MNKKILAAAVAASISAPVVAADVTISGAIRQSVDVVDYTVKNTTAGTEAKIDNVQINDRLSNLKLSGSEDLGNGMKAIFSAQWFLNISGPSATAPGLSTNNWTLSDGNNPSEFGNTAAWSHGNAFTGIAGDFGTVLIGRHDHPVKMSTGKLDIFANTAADNTMLYQTGADLRANGTVAYVSPSFSGFKVLGAMVPGENNEADGIADAYSVAAMYDNAGLYLSAGYEEGDACIDFLEGATCAAGDNDYEQTRLGAGYTMDAFHVNAVYTDIDNTYDSWKVAGSYTMGNNKLKAQYWDLDGEGDSVELDGWTIALDHNFSKRTQVSVLYNTFDGKGSVGAVDYTTDNDLFSVQMNHSF